jgi:DNA-binding transcriptional regulator of glucitol operon
MKAIAIGILAAACLALAGAWVLDTRFQQTAEQRFQTSGVRL